MRAATLVLLCGLFMTTAVYAEGPCSGGGFRGEDGSGNGSLDQQWGPDTFGYRAKDNASPGGPQVLWMDISSYGTEVTGLADDNIVGPFQTGFAFRYYWYDVSRFWIGSNGYIKFSSPGQLVANFSDLPNAAPPNDIVGPYIADWVFSSTDSSHCYYWSNHTDTLIVMWKTVEPYGWSSTRYNFELILSAVDSSITFQYGPRVGSGLTTYSASGIENLTGQIGLSTGHNFNTRQNYAIRYAYPSPVTYTGTDVAVLATQNLKSQGFFLLPGDTLRPWAQVVNLGTQDVAACSLRFVLREYGGAVQASFDTLLGAVNVLDTLTVPSDRIWTAGETGNYLIEATAHVPGDNVPSNDMVRTESHVVPVNGELAYDDSSSDAEVGWYADDHAMAMQFVPPYYPVAITGLRFVMSNWGSGSPLDIGVLDDDGPEGSPGTEIWTAQVAWPVPGWNTVALPEGAVDIQDGSFYVVCRVAGPCMFVIDTTGAAGISRRTWEYYPNGGWEQSRWWNRGEFMVRCTMSPALPPLEPFNRLEPVDESTVRWMDGPVQFRWAAARDSGLVTYHLTVNSDSYQRTFVTTDTTYSDSLAWFYGGGHFAHVTWSVWGTNGVDTVQAANGTGEFQLLANRAPGTFMRVAPADTFAGQDYDGMMVTFRWMSSADPDQDSVRYIFHCEHRPGDYPPPYPSDVVTGDTTLQVLVGSINDPAAGIEHYYWTVRATDNWDTVNASNGEGHFWVNLLDAPENANVLPREYALSTYPNPFNSTAVIRYDLPAASDVELRLYNLVGEEVATLVQGRHAPGRYRAAWNATAQASGTYFAVLKAGRHTKIQKLLLLK